MSLVDDVLKLDRADVAGEDRIAEHVAKWFSTATSHHPAILQRGERRDECLLRWFLSVVHLQPQYFEL